jgi:anti-sigma-K factor RskA
MFEPNDLRALAGEYVLGTLDEAERKTVDARLLNEPVLAAEIQSWEKWLLPLTRSAPEVEPSSGVWSGVMKKVFGIDPTQTVILVTRMQRWRGFAIAACLIAVLTTGMNFYSYQRGVAHNDVALLQKEQAVFMVSMNEEEHSFTVHMKGGEMPKDKSYELWLILDAKTPPISMGVLKASMTVLHPHMPSNVSIELVRQATLAISMEPMGGSPTGLPTGEVVTTGKFLAG